MVNDNSKYETQQYEKVISQHQNLHIHYIVNSSSVGPGPARNIGIKAGCGDYICFLDCDDYYIDDVVIYCEESKDSDYFISQIDNHAHLFTAHRCEESFGPIHGMGISRRFLEKFNLYFPEVRYGGEDVLFRLMCKSLSSNEKLFPDKTYYYHVDRWDSNFLHRNAPVKLPENEKIIRDRMGGVFWYANFIQYVQSLNIPNNYMDSVRWNFIVGQGVFSLYNLSMSNMHPDGYFLLMYIIKKYLNLRVLLPLFKHSKYRNWLIFIVFCEKYFSLKMIDDVEYLVFNENFKTLSSEYHEFFTQQQNFLPPYIIQHFSAAIPQYFNCYNLINIWGKLYYHDFFKLY